MKLLVILALFVLVACGTQPVQLVYVPADAVDTLQGYYVLPNGGYVDIYDDAQGLMTVRSIRLLIPNADTSVSLSPVVSTGALAYYQGAVYYSASPAYSPTHNVKKDSDNSGITGANLTQVIIYKELEVLNVRVIISSGSVVLFEHTVSELD